MALLRLQVASTCALAVCVVAGPPAFAAPDPGARPGPYVGKVQGHYKLSFSISSNGRALRGLDTAVVAYCVGLGPSGPTVLRVQMPSFKVSATGRFDRTYKVTTQGAVTIRFRGNLDRGTLKGATITYRSTVDDSECATDGPQPVSARHK